MSTVKKKILIVNNNMNIGGVQKALISLLQVLKDQYEVTLLLFYAHGELMDEIPSEVKVIETKGLFRYLGKSQGECASLKERLTRGFFAAIAKSAGFKWSVKLMHMLSRNEKLTGYDAAISYLHCAMPKSFYGGVAEYVKYYVKASKKICYIHCDYINSGTANSYSKSVYLKYDSIVGVSKSVAAQFVKALPQMKEKTFAVYNPIDVQKIEVEAQKDPYQYDPKYMNCLTVARLSAEKGVDRFVRVLDSIKSEKTRYYVVGDGKERQNIETLICEKGLDGKVFLLGEKDNPYRFMTRADLLVVPSYHEAAPVVFQEALILGLPIFTTDTLSAHEMISDKYGMVVDNTEEAMIKGMQKILEAPEILEKAKSRLAVYKYGEDDIPGALDAIIG